MASPLLLTNARKGDTIMVWDESEHPRDSDGKFTDGNGPSAKSGSIIVGKAEPAQWKGASDKKLVKIHFDYFGSKNKGVSANKKMPPPPSVAYGFDNERLTTPDHIRHREDMGFKDAKQYNAAAINYWENGKGKIYCSEIKQRYYKYRKDTEEFLSIDSEGIIKTYFKLPYKQFERKVYQEKLYEI